MTPVALSAVTGLLLISLFPSISLTYLAPVALAPLLVAIGREPRPGRRFLYGWIAGCVFWCGACYWIYYVLHIHGHVPAPGAAALFLGFFLVKGLHLGVFAWLAGPLLGRAWAIPAVAAAWTAVEGTHPYAGFTWLMLGNAATSMSALARLAPFTGVAGVSFALAMLNTAVALALLGRPRKHLAWVLAAPLLYLLPPLPAPASGRHAVRLVQPNIVEEEIYGSAWTPQRAREILGQFSALSLAGGSGPDLIVWPENPAPLYFYNDPLFRSYTEDIARREDAYLLFGTVAFRGEHEPLNSAVLLGPLGNEIARYDKIYLVPFGEFVPPPFGSLVEKVTREAGDFVPGDRVVVAQAGEHRIGTFICYESVFGRGVRRFVQGGAELLVNISNDGWFGRSAARDQHVLIARMRAIENRRWLLRATNTGVTAVIDPAGRVTGTLPVDRPGVLDAHFDYESGSTLYTRWVDWFWFSSCLGVLVVKGLLR
ncbi:MAG: apolipoprotein N-acyltransferase [Acidobacteria bacterium]|nr:apolipoprotein N-acyltransferase [Acidobacteriota bacterium]